MIDSLGRRAHGRELAHYDTGSGPGYCGFIFVHQEKSGDASAIFFLCVSVAAELAGLCT